MKVIVAGWSKTGTKSMNWALSMLGYEVYDFCENTFLLCDEYIKIVNEGWTTEDFKRMYENVDAVTDFPAWFFWEEIHKAFPEAKIILTVRDSEDEWAESFMRQIKLRDESIMYRLNLIFSPTYRKARRFTEALSWIALGMKPSGPFDYNTKMNASMSKRIYRAHNAYVMQRAPKDKLLIFNCKEGWAPLCEFLGVSIPEEPFPHLNVGGNVKKQMRFPLLEKVHRETMTSLAITAVACASLSVITYRYGIRGVYDFSVGWIFSKFKF